MASKDKEAPFLRRGGVVARKRKRPAVRFAVFGALGLAAAFGLFRFLSSSHFSVQRFEISGNTRARA